MPVKQQKPYVAADFYDVASQHHKGADYYQVEILCAALHRKPTLTMDEARVIIRARGLYNLDESSWKAAQQAHTVATQLNEKQNLV